MAVTKGSEITASQMNKVVANVEATAKLYGVTYDTSKVSSDTTMYAARASQLLTDLNKCIAKTDVRMIYYYKGKVDVSTTISGKALASKLNDIETMSNNIYKDYCGCYQDCCNYDCDCDSQCTNCSCDRDEICYETCTSDCSECCENNCCDGDCDCEEDGCGEDWYTPTPEEDCTCNTDGCGYDGCSDLRCSSDCCEENCYCDYNCACNVDCWCEEDYSCKSESWSNGECNCQSDCCHALYSQDVCGDCYEIGDCCDSDGCDHCGCEEDGCGVDCCDSHFGGYCDCDTHGCGRDCDDGCSECCESNCGNCSCNSDGCGYDCCNFNCYCDSDGCYD